MSVAPSRRMRQQEAKARENMALREEMLTKHGHDYLEEGTVAVFRKRFERGGETFTYSAVKANGKWYRSGEQGDRPLTWLELLLFGTERNLLKLKIRIVTQTEIYDESDYS